MMNVPDAQLSVAPWLFAVETASWPPVELINAGRALRCKHLVGLPYAPLLIAHARAGNCSPWRTLHRRVMNWQELPENVMSSVAADLWLAAHRPGLRHALAAARGAAA